MPSSSAEIRIVGTGPGPLHLLTPAARDALLAANRVLFRMSGLPVYRWLEAEGKELLSFDSLYGLPGVAYHEIYQFIAGAVVREATRRGDATYALPGNPMVFERTTPLVLELARSQGITTRVVPGMSFLELLYSELEVDPAAGVTITVPSALDQLEAGAAPKTALVLPLIGQTRRPEPVGAESNVCLVQKRLLTLYPASHVVSLVFTRGMPDYQTETKSFSVEELAAECEDSGSFATLYVPTLPCSGDDEPRSR